MRRRMSQCRIARKLLLAARSTKLHLEVILLVGSPCDRRYLGAADALRVSTSLTVQASCKCRKVLQTASELSPGARHDAGDRSPIGDRHDRPWLRRRRT